MIYQVKHGTTIEYARPALLAQFNVRLNPAPWPGQTVSKYLLWTTPTPWTIRDEEGGYLSRQTRLTLREPISRLEIDSSFTVEVRPPSADYAVAGSPAIAELRAAALDVADLSATSPASYLFASPLAPASPEIGRWARPHMADDAPVLDAGRALMAAINREFTYDPAATGTDTAADEAFQARHGVCQDFAHVMIAAARAHGIPAAYVSGYLRTLPPPGMQRLVGADAMHAWAALWCGDALGWVGFDPTNNLITATDHIFVAMGRDYRDVAPLNGVLHGGGGQTMFFSVDVAPLDGGG